VKALWFGIERQPLELHLNEQHTAGRRRENRKMHHGRG